MASNISTGVADLETATKAWQEAAERGEKLWLSLCTDGVLTTATLAIGETAGSSNMLVFSQEVGEQLAEDLKAAFEYKEWDAPVDGKPAFTDYRFDTSKPTFS